jgi:hypothetical protein
VLAARKPQSKPGFFQRFADGGNARGHVGIFVLRFSCQDLRQFGVLWVNFASGENRSSGGKTHGCGAFHHQQLRCRIRGTLPKNDKCRGGAQGERRLGIHDALIGLRDHLARVELAGSGVSGKLTLS